MDDIDEKIISLKMEAGENVAMSLEDGYYLAGKIELFEKTELFDQRVFVYLPKSFVDMPDQVKELKYPSAFRPQIIKTNLDSSVNFAFNIFEHSTGSNEGVEIIANGFRTALRQSNPAITFHQTVSKMIQENYDMTLFDFTSFGLDQKIYNLMCILSIEGQFIQGIFNCLERDKEQWEKAAQEVFLSVEID